MNPESASLNSKASVEVGSDRSFGLVFAAFFLILSVLPVFKGGSLKWQLLPASVVLGAIALAIPSVLHPFNVAWMKFGAFMQKIVSPLILAIVFFFVITPIALILRITGRRPIALGFDRKASTYWVQRDEKLDPESLKHTF